MRVNFSWLVSLLVVPEELVNLKRLVLICFRNSRLNLTGMEPVSIYQQPTLAVFLKTIALGKYIRTIDNNHNNLIKASSCIVSIQNLLLLQKLSLVFSHKAR